MKLQKISLIIFTIISVLAPNSSYAILQSDENAVINDSIYYIRNDQDCPAGTTPMNGTSTGKPVIALDPGHGADIAPYIDSVTQLADRETNNLPEGDDVLAVANDVRTQLETAGYTVVMLRSAPGEAINKRDRVNKAIAAKAAMAVSIHTTPGDMNDVWPQRVGSYRQYNDVKVTFENANTAATSLKYSQAIAAARQAAEGHTISLDEDLSHEADSFGEAREDLPSKGNISLLQLWATDLPWVYNEIGQNDGTAISDELKKKYAEGIVKGIQAALPATTASSTTPTSGNSTVVCCPPGGGSGLAINLTGDSNIAKIMNFLMDKTNGPGFTVAGAAGAVGNFMVEAPGNGANGADIKPNIQQSGAGHEWPIGGWGIAQWTAGRRHGPNQLVDRIKAAGLERLYTNDTSQALDLSPADNDALLAVELKFMMDELNGSYGATLSQGRAATDASQSARDWEQTYEGCTPTYTEAECGVDKRRAKAVAIYTAYADKAPTAPTATGDTAPASNTTSTAICTGGGGAAGGSFNDKVLSYAWPEYRGDPYDKSTDGYKQAWVNAPAGSYSGGAGQSSGELGIDCGAFVTRLTIDSGFDPNYNSKGLESAGAGPTETQYNWLVANWQDLGGASTIDVGTLRPGDVAITRGSGHTFVFVGTIPGFGANLASASVYTRAPMADTAQSPTEGRFEWFRKK